ncbi:general stress protein [Nonomuraea sp. SYSU D8015]|uniref:general stress protein n=1 Tax=Nonomuraea sp. SYSU D8015 TaxID=2593644 RepID=UPI0016602AFC|nr:general stress protein [Nonomuraea sp. SYSU D8015]
MFKTGPTVILPSVEDRPVVGTYSTAEQADKAVAFLAGNGFPVERAGIVGHDLRLVETVLGRASAWRAVGAGAGTGVWFGVLLGLLMPLFTGGSSVALMLGGMAYGALFGAAFGLVSYWTTRGGRGFVSRRDLVADRYDVVADAAVADDARNLLAKHNWRS